MNAGLPRDARVELLRLLAGVRQRWFRSVALRTTGRAAALAAIPVGLGATIDWLARPRGGVLLALAAATFVLASAAAAAVFRRMQRRPDDRHVARFVEERSGRVAGARPMDDALASAVDVVEKPQAAHSGFSDLIVAQAVARLRDIDPSQVIEPAAMRRSALEAAGGGALLAIVVALAAPAVSKTLDTARLLFFPASIHVEVVPGDVRLPAGMPLRIRATVKDQDGAFTLFTPSLTVSAGGDRRVVEMRATPGGFEFAFDSVDRTFTYSVTAGAAKSADYTVTALFAPRVRQIDLEYTYPAFTGLAPRLEEDGGDIYAPSGTRVRLLIHTDKPARGELARAAAAAAPLRASGDCALEADLVLEKDDSYRIRLADDDGLRSGGETEYFIRVMDDRPPEVRILRPSFDQPITPLEEITIEARADDDYGVAKFDLVYAVAGGPEHVVGFDRITGTDIEKVGSRLIAAEELKVKPGDVITYYARARDVARGKRSTEARSDIFFLEVKPFNEEFVVAQSQAASASGDAELDGLVSAQKEIISATWNIERRSGAGRSPVDVAAIAKAQAELKARAERMSRGSGRGRPPAPAPERAAQPQQPGRPSGDPIAAAVAAMTRALRQLEGQKTTEALPHEMAALNGLLQAQAEVRRRQVSQGASGSGSGNRSGQDLSALFDKELQRQQKTNYENRSSVEERPERAENRDSAFDRVRDLARRQEDLSRRQRELAASGMTAEEIKRQLETLTREQMELRQQAEDLARDMKQQQGDPQGQPSQRGQQQGSSGQESQQKGGQQATGGAGSEVERAADQMRSAASELRRENAGGAAESGERATEQLQRLEEQMRKSGAPGSTRGADDLQVEAQQVAQEQRRIAAEASRLENSRGTAADEARRRLAEEKDRLAGRVERLQRSAREVGSRGGSDPGSKAAADAAKELEGQRIAGQMRDTAKQMREGMATPEQQLSRALDKAVDKLGGGSAEARGLADQLDETRQIRERLNKLEQQMRDAEARALQASRGTSDELEKLQQEYQRELQRAQEALGKLEAGAPRSGRGASTPEQQEFSRSAPGTEAFKQDRSGWESLRKGIDLSLEKYEASLSDRLARKPSGDRLNAGGSDRVPEAYRDWIARYYQSLAKVKK